MICPKKSKVRTRNKPRLYRLGDTPNRFGVKFVSTYDHAVLPLIDVNIFSSVWCFSRLTGQTRKSGSINLT